MELKQTVEMMNSADYKERFKAEYMQVVVRYKKLANMLEKWDKGELPFTPTCPRSTYNMQVRAMTDYIAVLEARAVMEKLIWRYDYGHFNTWLMHRNRYDLLHRRNWL